MFAGQPIVGNVLTSLAEPPAAKFLSDVDALSWGEPVFHRANLTVPVSAPNQLPLLVDDYDVSGNSGFPSLVQGSRIKDSPSMPEHGGSE